MPTYGYKCPEGHQFDRFFRSISGAARELECPTCGRVAQREVSGGAGLVFKGSGFYITDYGKDGKKDQKKDGKPSTDAKGSTEGATSGGGASATPSAAPVKETPAPKGGSES